MKNTVKKVVLVLVALSFVACSSKEKVEAPKVEEALVVEEKATPGGSTGVSKVKSKLKKGAVASKEANSAPATEATSAATTSSESSFPAVTGTEKSSVTCSTNNDTRKISVLNEAGGGCGVVYNKGGADKTVAVAKANLSHCDTVAAKIQSNLEAAGYNCGDGATTPAAAEAAP